MPVRNGEATITEQLDALAVQDFDGDWELLVVDNGCTDSTVAIVEARNDVPVSVVDARHRAGINVARNAGLATAVGELVLFCDADDRVGPRWITAMAEAARDAHVLGGRVDEHSLNAATTPGRPPIPVDRLPVALGFLPFAMGANCGAWREVLEALGGWDEGFYGGNDDVDLSFRAQLAGYQVTFVPDAVVAYRHREGFGPLFRQFRGYGRMDPRLYARYRDAGLERPSLRSVLRRWARLSLLSPLALVDPVRRGRWSYQMGYTIGRVEGSLRDRVLYL